MPLTLTALLPPYNIGQSADPRLEAWRLPRRRGERRDWLGMRVGANEESGIFASFSPPPAFPLSLSLALTADEDTSLSTRSHYSRPSRFPTSALRDDKLGKCLPPLPLTFPQEGERGHAAILQFCGVGGQS